MVTILPEKVNNLWNRWDVRVMVLTSLFLQIILTIFGSKRKHIARNWVRVVTWITYLSADWVATVALGMISNVQADPSHLKNTIIMAFWSPFLLVHLGGPDTITAYALEDNELWLRHMLGLLVQVAVVIHIFLKSWPTSKYELNLLALLIFVAGILKYGERTVVLWSASREKFSVTVDMSSQSSTVDMPSLHSNTVDRSSLHSNGVFDNRDQQDQPLLVGYKLFKNIVRRLYLNLSIDREDVKLCEDTVSRYVSEKRWDCVFELLEVELGFMYDVLYTKAKAVHSIRGIIFRSISLFCHISAFVVFFIFIDKRIYESIDVIVTYLLTVGAIALDLYAVFVLVFTDWTLLWLKSHKKPTLVKLVSFFFPSKCHKRWSNSMAQYNLIDFCLKSKGIPKGIPKGLGTKRLIGVCTKTEKYLFMSFEDVKDEMKSFILTQLQGLQVLLRNRNVKEVLNLRGRHALGYRNCLANLDWSVTGPKLPFHKSILYWHIATDICYYEDLEIIGSEEAPPFQRLSKLLSDYMAYILVMRPFMLPKGIGQISVRDTCSHAISFFKERRRSIHTRHEARRLLMNEGNVKTEDAPPSEWKKSVLAEGCKLAEELQRPDIENGWWSLEEKWEMIAKVWVEILCYAASDCGWEHHAQQLRRGGELLTHISLLMAHLGLSEQLPPSSRGNPSFP